MNIVCLFGILLIVAKTNGYPETNQRKEDPLQRILLRKLQSSQRSGAAGAESVTWNEILADALVTKLNVFSNNVEVSKPKNIAATFLSEILMIYKNVYDKFKPKTNERGNVNTVLTPKEEVEIIGADKIENCDNCGLDETPRVEKDVECVKGFVLDKDGNCVPVPSKLILAVPKQCPIGYRADRLGFCRIYF